jgi:hypothetical protein
MGTGDPIDSEFGKRKAAIYHAIPSSWPEMGKYNPKLATIMKALRSAKDLATHWSRLSHPSHRPGVFALPGDFCVPRYPQVSRIRKSTPKADTVR